MMVRRPSGGRPASNPSHTQTPDALEVPVMGEQSTGAGWSRRDVLVRAGAVGGAGAVGLVAPPTAAFARPDRPEDFDATVATAWFDLTLELIRTTPGFTPPVAARTLGYAGVALYEAVAPSARGYQSLGRVLPGLPGLPRPHGRLHGPTAANAALARIVRALFPTATEVNRAAIDALESTFLQQAHGALPRSTRRASVEHGRDVARAVFEWSRDDGGHEGYWRNFPPGYEPPAGPGLWVPTPPAFQPALQPFWGVNRCLAVPGGTTCPPGDHSRYSEQGGSAFFTEAIEVYDAVNNLTVEQEAIARFWSDDSGATVTPPGHSISIATQVLRREDASLTAAAETYLKAGIAVCDAFVACWNTKYRYNLLRPVTYIQRVIDPAWLPLLGTPPFPEYTSGHSVQSGAAFAVLTDLWGENYAFEDRTHDARGLAPRRFTSFTQAAEEAALSRLYGGIHFRPAIERGLEQGRCLADAVNRLPVHR
jgi:hypothetical protein